MYDYTVKLYTCMICISYHEGSLAKVLGSVKLQEMPCLPAEVVPWKHKDWKSDWGQPVAKYAWHFWNKTLRILTAESHQLFICTFPIHCITFLKSTMVLTSWDRDNSNENQLFPLELVRSMPSFAVEVNARIGRWGLRWHENRLKPVLQEMSLS